MTCAHKSGDWVNGYWLCGPCYAKLADRPVRYEWEAPHNAGNDEGGRRRQRAVRAPIATAPEGTTLSQFVRQMALRLLSVTGGAFTDGDAIDYAVEVLRLSEDPFGEDDFDWSTAGAWERIEEDMQTWDFGRATGNS